MGVLPTLVGLLKTFLSQPSGLLKEAQIGSECEFKRSANPTGLAELLINPINFSEHFIQVGVMLNTGHKVP